MVVQDPNFKSWKKFQYMTFDINTVNEWGFHFMILVQIAIQGSRVQTSENRKWNQNRVIQTFFSRQMRKSILQFFRKNDQIFFSNPIIKKSSFQKFRLFLKRSAQNLCFRSLPLTTSNVLNFHSQMFECDQSYLAKN